MRDILKGATDQSVVIRIVDASDGTPETGVTSATGGLDLKYRREGAATVNLTESDLSALTDAHADGGMLHINAGYYRLDLPDAACASGANGVLVSGTVTGMVVIGCYIHLVDYNPQDGVRLGLTALPNAAAEAAGGLYTRGTGAGQIAQDANGRIDVNVAKIETADPSDTIRDAVVDDATRIDASALNTASGAIGSNGSGLTEAGGDGDHLTAINLPDQTMNITGNITGNLSGSVGSVTGAVTVGTNNDKTGYGLSAAAVQAIWDALTSALTTVGSIGKLLVDNINSTISSRASQSTADAIEADTQDIQSRIGTPANLGGGATLAGNLQDIEGQTDDIGVAGAGLTAIPDSAGVTTLLSRIPAALFSGITSLAQWLGIMAGKQTGNSTARTELRATGAGSGTFDETTDSLEAGRDNIGTSGAGLAAVDDAVLAAIAALNNLAAGAAMTLTSGERDAIAAALLDLSNGIETGLTLRQAQRLQSSAAAGKLSGAATPTVVLRNAVADTKDRITATVDADGNRSAITTDLT